MLRVLFAGTPEFAVASLAALANAQAADVVGVLTQPDRPRGRGRRVTPSPVKAAAEARGIEVLQPTDLTDPAFLARFDELAPDLMVVAAYGRILTQAFIDRPRLGTINVHASLLPRWRGAAPIQRALMAGDSETGITIMRVVRELDAGPIILCRAVPIGPETTFPELHDALAELGGRALAEALAQAEPDGFASETPQDPAQVTYAHKITAADCLVEWRGDAATIDRQVRALTPRPGATAEVTGITVKLLAGRALGSIPGAVPGSLVRHGAEGIVVACGDGAYAVTALKPEGKGQMSAAEFSNGYLSRRAAAR